MSSRLRVASVNEIIVLLFRWETKRKASWIYGTSSMKPVLLLYGVSVKKRERIFRNGLKESNPNTREEYTSRREWGFRG